jgi:hypothetical protein
MKKSPVLLVLLAFALALGAACSRARSDEAIANDIKAKFFSHEELKQASLEVAVSQGEVTLRGEAPSDSARHRAYVLASETEGVKRVTDQMTVHVAEAPAPAPAPEPARPAPRPQAQRPTPPPPPPATPAQPDPSPTSAPAAAAPAPAAPPEPVTKRVQIPSGSRLTIQMIDSVDSEVHKTGQVFRASLDEPLMHEDDVVVPRGADVYVKLIESKSAGRMAGRSELRLELVRMVVNGRSYLLDSTEYEQAGASRGKQTATRVGIGAAAGAAIGAIAGGGKGAAIGAAAGAGTGTAVQVFTKGQQVRIPSETRLEFHLEAPVDITYTPGQPASRR